MISLSSTIRSYNTRFSSHGNYNAYCSDIEFNVSNANMSDSYMYIYGNFDMVGLNITMNNTDYYARIINITADNFLFDSNSSFIGDGRGCTRSESPNSSNVCDNQGTSSATVGYGEGGDSSYGGGAGYGGRGGRGYNDGSDSGGYSYGSALVPVLFGSGGGSTSYGGLGGGIIRIDIENYVDIDGVMSVDATSGINTHGGGGSGGSIYITTYNVSGSGSLTSTGGAGYDRGGGGAGGRIAVYYNSSTFDVSDSTVVGGVDGKNLRS